MGFGGGGPSRPPASAFPHDAKSKDAFTESRFRNASPVASLILVLAGALWFVGMWMLGSGLVYLGLALWAAAVAVFVLWR